MIIRVNTGYYRVCRHQIGIANSIEYLIDGDFETINNYWDNIIIADPKIIYYKEEQIIYRGSRLNQYNEIDESKPIWVRM